MGNKRNLAAEFLCNLLLLCFYGTTVSAKYIKYNTGADVVPGKLNVHLVAHSHDDVGWLKNVDQYYVGSNNNIQSACVENVLDSVVMSLQRDPNRKFVNGGWCMHDEATTHYIDMIDQTTLGHRFIKEHFNKTPTAGWQIDPFGHSAVQAYLLGAEVGFDSVHFGRIDYQDREYRKANKSLEVVWRGSKTLGSSAQIFANAFPVRYTAPDGYNFELIKSNFDPIQDDPRLYDYNVQQHVQDFIDAAMVQDGRVNALYSTPSIYTTAKNAANQTWPLKTNDYFPYADAPNAYWTGYFTSRPALKGYATRQIEIFVGKKSTKYNSFDLGDALGIAQHHDAVSGTAKSHTTRDYVKRLAIGASMAETIVSSSLACLTSKQSSDQCSTPTSVFTQCQLLNISYCPTTEDNIPEAKSLVVVVYNPLGWNRTDVVKIPVNDDNLVVENSLGNNLEVQYVDVDNVTKKVRELYVEAYLGVSPKQGPKYWLLFQVSVPPLGWSTYFISKAIEKGTNRRDLSQLNNHKGESINIGSGNLKMSFSSTSGQLQRMYNSKTGVDIPIQQNYLWYESYSGYQASGAYIFRPDGSPKNVSGPTKVIRGPLVDEVHQKINNWIYQIGPIPTDGWVGKEVITRMATNMTTNKEFYTDSNGRDFLKRLNLGIYIKDKKTEFSILVDRAVGGANINDGEVELMLHRRIFQDDGRGVDEALDEQVCINNNNKCEGLTVRGNYYMGIHNLGDGSQWRRTTGQEIYSPLLLAFTHENIENWKSSHLIEETLMDPNYSLPLNVALITLEELDGGIVILRLAHLYEENEDVKYSTMTKVELKKLFAKKTIKELKEVSLSANQEKSKMKKMTWSVEGDKFQEPQPVRGGPVSNVDFVVELGPMEIRTFLLKF
ncbi:hypothetical protein VNO78_34973 [Psophocarpus tetragonolobus]|uniref:Alpha-mannosidase n=1 Tax=Psophocarpus tetragonolobus TaxID=3891 RepID=A0AAN9NT58_PSOTE